MYVLYTHTSYNYLYLINNVYSQIPLQASFVLEIVFIFNLTVFSVNCDYEKSLVIRKLVY